MKGVTVTSYREPSSVIPILTFVLHFDVIKRLPHVASAVFQMYGDPSARWGCILSIRNGGSNSRVPRLIYVPSTPI